MSASASTHAPMVSKWMGRTGISDCGHRAAGGFAKHGPDLEGLHARRLRSGVEQQVIDLVVQSVDALDHHRDDITISCIGDPAVEHLQRRPQARQRIANFVRHDSRQLSEMRQRRLLTQLRFGKSCAA